MALGARADALGAEILEFQTALLEDEDLLAPVFARIAEGALQRARNGVALITALLVTTLATVAAVAMARDSRVRASFSMVILPSSSAVVPRKKAISTLNGL